MLLTPDDVTQIKTYAEKAQEHINKAIVKATITQGGAQPGSALWNLQQDIIDQLRDALAALGE